MRQVLAFIILQIWVWIPMLAQSKKTTREQYISKYYQLAIQEMNLYKIPASIILAQGILETESGNSDLARIANNHFGIKCKRTWEGMKYIKDDDTKDECFRAYSNVEESYRDHSLFLQNERYASLFRLETRDYKSWAYGLKSAGYATNPSYPILLIKHIEEMELYQFDNYGGTSQKPKNKIDSSGKEDMEDYSSGLLDTNKLKLLAKFTSNDKANNLKFVPVDNDFDILSISQRTGSPISYLFKCNDIEGPSQLFSGQNFFLQLKLKSNPLSIHEVKSGETLYEISQAYGVQMEYLKKYNILNSWEQPAVGEIVYLNKMRSSPIKTRSLEEVMAEKKQMAEEAENKKRIEREQKSTEFYLATATTNTRLPNSDKSILFHQVKAKENIFKIAKLYDVKPNEILEWNQLSLEAGVHVGQTLKVISSIEPIIQVSSQLKVNSEDKGIRSKVSNNPMKEPAVISPANKAEAKQRDNFKGQEAPAKTAKLRSNQAPETSNLNVSRKENTKTSSSKLAEAPKKISQTSTIVNLEELILKTKTEGQSDSKAQGPTKKLIIAE